ncbi:MAG: hypothetical protein ACRDZW_01295 [Acidimicrobiales bacterium]
MTHTSRTACGRGRRPVQVTLGDDHVPADGPTLEQALDANGRFRRDTRLGRIFHPGKVSFREVSSHDSLHIIIDGQRVSAHVDEISPLNCDPDGSSHYRWSRVLAHNASGMATDFVRRLTGRHGEHRCNLECEVVWVDDVVEDAATD